MKSLRCFVLTLGAALAWPASANMSDTVDALASMEQAARAAHSDAVVVMRGDETLLQIKPTRGSESIHLMSATKSVVAIAIALLLDEGKLASIDEPVSTIYPEWSQGRKKDITVRMLLDHTSGLQNVANAGEELEGAPDLIKLALAAELSHEPGTTFSYNNKATNLLAGVVERLAGMPMDVYLNERLFKPLGIRQYSWMKDYAGTPLGMAGLSLSATDLAAIGRLMLDGGKTSDGTRLLSQRSVDLLTSESAHSPDVGLLWWRVPEWERYELKPGAAALLAERGVGPEMRGVVQETAGRTFESKAALIGFFADRMGNAWSQRYGEEILSRGLKLSDMFDVTRGPVKAFAANGYLGQHLVIVPEKRLVAVRQIARREDHQSPRDDYAAFPADVLRLADTLD